MSEGWQSRTLQISFNASTGKCLTAPVQIAETVGGLIPVLSASSFCVISRIASITLTLNFITKTHPFLLVLYHDFRNKSILKTKKYFQFRKRNYEKGIDKLRIS